jgi:hypothetical protein
MGSTLQNSLRFEGSIWLRQGVRRLMGVRFGGRWRSYELGRWWSSVF